MDPNDQTRTDPLLPMIREVVAELLNESATVVPLDVLLRLELVEDAAVQTWRSGGLPYLELGIRTGLSRVNRVLRLLRAHALSLGLMPAPGKYQRRGSGPKRRLRFSKRGDAASEAAYGTHYLRRPAVAG